jgi:2-C-methyl-D-erythritol 4-phosphate cytidylyltransferase
MDLNKKRYAVILAGGKGLRMGSYLPKQFLLLDGRPVLMRTMDAFYEYDPDISIILVLPEDQMDFWGDLCKLHKFSIPYRLTKGGKTRFDSVMNGLAETDNEGLIAVHDGVRPLVSSNLLNRCFETASIFGAVVPVTGVVESIRKVDGDSSVAVSREDFWLVQTPQVFDAAVLHESYNNAPDKNFTDDASVVEYAGKNIRLVEGIYENIKITTPSDMIIAEALWLARKKEQSKHFIIEED